MNSAQTHAGSVFVSLFAAWVTLAGMPATGPLFDGRYFRWELKPTRRWGVLTWVAGPTLFAIFVLLP